MQAENKREPFFWVIGYHNTLLFIAKIHHLTSSILNTKNGGKNQSNIEILL
jgi:hypothetical protein